VGDNCDGNFTLVTASAGIAASSRPSPPTLSPAIRAGGRQQQAHTPALVSEEPLAAVREAESGAAVCGCKSGAAQLGLGDV